MRKWNRCRAVVAASLAIGILAGCAELTPREKQVLEVGVAIVVTGAIVARQGDHGDQRRDTQPVDCTKVDCK